MTKVALVVFDLAGIGIQVQVKFEYLEKLDYLIGNALRDQDVENRLPQIQREIESSLQVGV